MDNLRRAFIAYRTYGNEHGHVFYISLCKKINEFAMNDKTIFFQKALLDWFHSHGRHDLPWQNQSPYHVWLSEIMLQQTQVATVLSYYERFITAFPTLSDLATASEEQVFALWAGLGYYSRAKNLHQTAKIIHQQFNGQFPNTPDELLMLPGIGPSTCAAILSQAFHQPYAICDGNVKRVLGRYWGITDIKSYQKVADSCMPQQNCQRYTQAIMDMGATCCKNKVPLCNQCPLSSQCWAFQNQQVAQFPIKLKRIARKTVRYDFLGYHNAKGEYFWIKRSSKGIWPNLWCFPQIETQETGKIIHHHDLTHQKMEIHLHFMKKCEVDIEGKWLNLSQSEQLAIPQAFKVLLKAISLHVKS
jgi:A/G-specific adenine glycosylase